MPNLLDRMELIITGNYGNIDVEMAKELSKLYESLRGKFLLEYSLSLSNILS